MASTFNIQNIFNTNITQINTQDIRVDESALNISLGEIRQNISSISESEIENTQIIEYINKFNHLSSDSNRFDIIYYLPFEETFFLDNVLKFHKNNIVDLTFDNVENYFDSVLRKNKKYILVKNKIKQKLQNINEIQNKLVAGLQERKNVLNKISYTKNIKDLISNNTSTKINLIHKKYIDLIGKINYENNIVIFEGKKDFFSKDVLETNSRQSFFINRQNLKKYCLIDFDSNNNSINEIDETSLITQLFVNFSRSLYTLMPNCIYYNTDDVTNFSFNFEKNNYSNVLRENDKVKVWEYISGNSFDYVNFIKENKPILNNDLGFISNRNSIIETNGENGLFFKIKNTDMDIITKLNEEMSYVSSEESLYIGLDKFVSLYNAENNETHTIDDVLVVNHPAIELHNLFNGNYYKTNLTCYSPVNTDFGLEIVTPEYGIYYEATSNNDVIITDFRQDMLEAAGYDQWIRYDIDPTSEKYIKNRFLDQNADNSLVNKPFEQIFVNKKPFYKVVDEREILGNNLLDGNKNNVKFQFNNSLLNLNNKSLDLNKFIVKVDSLIKKIKNVNLDRLDFDRSVVDEIILNIKNSIHKNNILSFTEKNDSQLSLTNKDSKLFKMMFSKSEDEDSDYTSNFSLNTDIKNHGKTFKNILRNNTLTDNTSQIDEFLKFMSNYFIDNCYLTASYFLNTIHNDIIKYTSNIDINTYEISDFLTSSLLFNYFQKNINGDENSNEIKRVIAKRFIKNAIKNDTNTLNSLKNSKLNEFTYNNKLFESNEYTTASDIEKVIKNHKKSSQALTLISESVFSKDNIDSLSKKYNFSKVFIFTTQDAKDKYFDKIQKELGLSVETPYGDLESLRKIYEDNKVTTLSFESITIDCVLPFVHFLDTNVISNKVLNEIYNYNIFLIKNDSYTVDENTESASFTSNRIILEDRIAFHLYVGKNGSDQSLVLKNTKGKLDDDRDVQDVKNIQHIFVKDKFDDLCDREDDILYSITKKIQMLLRTHVKEYSKKLIKTEQDIDNLIFENDDIINDVIEIIDIYSLYYDNVLERLNTRFNLKRFSQYSDYLNFENLRNDLYAKFFDENPEIKDTYIIDAFKLRNNSRSLSQILNDESLNELRFNIDSREIVGDYIKLHEKFYNDFDSFDEEKIEISNITNEFFESSMIDISNIQTNISNISLGASNPVLSLSDTIVSESPAINSIFLNDNIDTKNDLFLSKIELCLKTLVKSEVFQVLNFDLLRAFLLSLSEVEDFEDEIFNQNLSDVSSYLNTNSNDFFDKINNVYFQNLIIKYLNREKIVCNAINENVYLNIDNENIEEYFEENRVFDFYKNTQKIIDKTNINKRDIYAINISYDNIKNLEENALIKVTITPRDIYNNNKIYLPKTKIFSLNMSNLNTKLAQFEDSEVVIFEKNLEDRFSSLRFVNERDNFTRIKDKIYSLKENYFRGEHNDFDIFVNFSVSDIFNNHKKSFTLNETMDLIKDISIYDDKFVDTTLVNEIMSGVSEDDMLDIFNMTVSEFNSQINNVNFSNINMLGKSITSLMSSMTSFNTEEYDRYIFDVNLEKLPFYVKSSSELSIFEEYTLTEEDRRGLYFEKFNIQNMSNLKFYIDTFDPDKKNLNYSIKIEAI
jgi:hypothetical protein